MYKKKYSYKVCPCKVCLSGLALNKKLLKQKKCDRMKGVGL